MARLITLAQSHWTAYKNLMHEEWPPGRIEDSQSSSMTGEGEQTHDLSIAWTNPAQSQLVRLPNDPRFNGDPRAWHEREVREYAKRYVPEANRARIRKPVHSGGVDPTESWHITVTYKKNNRDLAICHVYTATA
ncbi:hypothetical protein PsYK624_061160 [Phanerochaete sordida]|uniref:Uncharacterized protein n=1 Tax=Phanerochaete sordida TaxID=48140 RepID=A0A9P3LBZ8_9APHY|nr:hypothetical protein PsYK624_061160 [Phanerochaete sordida]